MFKISEPPLSKPEQKLKNGKPVDYHTGATKAYKKLLEWMKEKTPYGVSSRGANKHSFSFDGKYYLGKVEDGDCRRIDLDVLKGEILKS